MPGVHGHPKDRILLSGPDSLSWMLVAGGGAVLVIGAHLAGTTPFAAINASLILSGFALAGLGLTRAFSAEIPRRVWASLARPATWLGIEPRRLLLVGLGLASALAARSAAGDGSLVHSPLATPLWVAGIALAVAGLWVREQKRTCARWPTWEVALLAAITLAGLALRAWEAGSLPRVLSGDEGSAGMIGWEFRTGERDNLLSLGWYYFPALYFWIVSLFQAVFGRSVEAIRWVSSLGGALTIVALYVAARALYGRTVALWSALWLTTFHHHLFFSRVAYNNIWDGFFLIAAAGALWRGWSEGRRAFFLAAGVLIGLAQYFYATSHVALAVILVWLLLLAWRARRSAPAASDAPAPRDRAASALSMGIAAAVTVMPLGLLYLDYPGAIAFAAGRVSLFVPGWTDVARSFGLSPLGFVLEQTWVTALGLTVAELEGVYYAPGVPLLFGLSMLLFLLGLGICLLRCRDPRYSLPLLVLLATLLVGGLSIQAPNSQRMILLPPFAAILVALPLHEVWRRLAAAWPRTGPAVAILGTVLILFAMAENARHFFLDYLPDETYAGVNAEVAQAMATFLAEQDPSAEVYFLGGERMYFDSFASLTYLWPEAHGQDLVSPYALPNEAGPEGTHRFFILLPEVEDVLPSLTTRFGEGTIIRRYNRVGRILFTVFEVGQTP